MCESSVERALPASGHPGPGSALTQAGPATQNRKQPLGLSFPSSTLVRGRGASTELGEAVLSHVHVLPSITGRLDSCPLRECEEDEGSWLRTVRTKRLRESGKGREQPPEAWGLSLFPAGPRHPNRMLEVNSGVHGIRVRDGRETWFFTVAFEKMHCRCKSTPWTGDVEQVHAHPYPAAGHTGTCRQSHRGIGTEPQLGGTPQCREELWHSGPGYCPLKGLLTRVALGGGQGTWISGGFL